MDSRIVFYIFPFAHSSCKTFRFDDPSNEFAYSYTSDKFNFWWLPWSFSLTVLVLIVDDFRHRFRLHVESLLVLCSSFVRSRFLIEFTDGIFLVVINIVSKWFAAFASFFIICLILVATFIRHRVALVFWSHFGSFRHPFVYILVALGTFSDPFWFLLQTSFVSAPEAANHLRTNGRHPHRKNSPFQGHVRTLAEGNLRTDAIIINYCHIYHYLH